MNLLDQLFGTQVPLVAKMLIAFGVIFGLLALLWFVGRRFMPGPRVGLAANRNRQPRLGVLDAHTVDARRKLVLIRRDNVEHLIMIGGPNDVVIESTILRGRPQSRPPSPPAPGERSIAPSERLPERSAERLAERPAPLQAAAPPLPPTPAQAPMAAQAPAERMPPLAAERVAPPPPRPVERPIAPPPTERAAPPIERAAQAERSHAAAIERVQQARPAQPAQPPIAPPSRSLEAELGSRNEDAPKRPMAHAAPPAQTARPAWAIPERRNEPAREEAASAMDTSELEASLFAEEPTAPPAAPRRNFPAFERPAASEIREAPPPRSLPRAATPEFRIPEMRPAEPRRAEPTRSEVASIDPSQREAELLEIVPERSGSPLARPATPPPSEHAAPPPVIALPDQHGEPTPIQPQRAQNPMPTFSPRRAEPAMAAAEPLRRPEPAPESPRPVSQDPFASLEEEMASLLGRIPGGAKQ